MKALAIVVLLVGLFAFAKARNAAREVTGTHIVFQGDTPPLISRLDVNKMLIQFQDSSQSTFLETIDLNKSENMLNTNEMIKNTEVSLSLDGRLSVEIQQREPLVRIMGDHPAYLDNDNQIMPLSSEHSVMVPLVFNFDARRQADLYKLATFLQNHESLRNHFSQYVMEDGGGFTLYALEHEIPIRLGRVEQLTAKMYNYRAYMEIIDHEATPRQIDLRFAGQVVVKKQENG